MNKLTYNVGYHNEHHDFPQIPQTKLHEVCAAESQSPCVQLCHAFGALEAASCDIVLNIVPDCGVVRTASSMVHGCGPELLNSVGSHRLQLQKIAPEYYLTLKHHTSWCYVIWSFLTDPEVWSVAPSFDVANYLANPPVER
jgi:hypothetical protein